MINRQPVKGSTCMVEERSVSLCRCAVRHAGGIRSANADMSNDKRSENFVAENLRVSAQG